MGEEMNFQRTAKIKKGIAGTVAIALIGFVLFVLVRNDFAVDMNDLPGAVRNALGLRTVAEQQESILAQLDVTPNEIFKQKVGGKIVTVVSGQIQNKSRYTIEKVLVEGRLYDGGRNLRLTTPPVPCGRTAEKKELAGMNKKKLEAFYKGANGPYNCAVMSEHSVSLMVLFPTLPDDFNSTFKFEVHPHSGQFQE